MKIEIKLLLWAAYLFVSAACAAAVIFAPQLGLGEQFDFILYRKFGLQRSIALALIVLLAFLFGVFELLAIGVLAPAGHSRYLSTLKSMLSDGSDIIKALTGHCPTFRVWTHNLIQ